MVCVCGFLYLSLSGLLLIGEACLNYGWHCTAKAPEVDEWGTDAECNGTPHQSTSGLSKPPYALS